MTIFFRFPHENSLYTTDFSEEHSSVSFISFDGKSEIKIAGNIVSIEKEDLHKNAFPLPEKKEFSADETQEEYIEKINQTIRIIKENRLPKLVISRKKNIPVQNPDIPKTFLNLCEKYPSAFVYAFENNGNCWIGAFSELLGKFNKKTSEFETMSLAGTLPLEEEWTSKEIEEQKPVTEYIAGILGKYAKDVEQSETFDHISGNIKHLRTDFRIKLEEKHLDQLISKLHPTPAVCGIPKDFCKEQIQNLEQFSRELYGGYSRTETEDFICFFVNLRCGKVYSNCIELFAGGGITALSSPEKEWRETELKMQALGKNLVFK
ncbi:MAG: chorismate-binding protein [Bergeyella sp.]